MNDAEAQACAPLAFRPAAVFFDMDGLLLDSESALLDCWREAARTLGLRVDDGVWLSMIGLSDAVCDELLGRRVGQDDARALRDRCHALYDARVVGWRGWLHAGRTIEQIADAHAMIIDAVEAGDPDRAERAMHDHLDQASFGLHTELDEPGAGQDAGRASARSSP